MDGCACDNNSNFEKIQSRNPTRDLPHMTCLPLLYQTMEFFTSVNLKQRLLPVIQDPTHQQTMCRNVQRSNGKNRTIPDETSKHTAYHSCKQSIHYAQPRETGQSRKLKTHFFQFTDLLDISKSLNKLNIWGERYFSVIAALLMLFSTLCTVPDKCTF